MSRRTPGGAGHASRVWPLKARFLWPRAVALSTCRVVDASGRGNQTPIRVDVIERVWSATDAGAGVRRGKRIVYECPATWPTMIYEPRAPIKVGRNTRHRH
ncbi:hypothetical protein EVAR_27818_1 [Eumeta japonica]|uniref:Uncharacterized protein n=1 Tax=Eumeta variegata TaxID=151549 RepID=A0A4C1VJR6_EUMVA|nr:hypothetical protein EVAR_27818_1 [Eumeta japonica]